MGGSSHRSCERNLARSVNGADTVRLAACDEAGSGDEVEVLADDLDLHEAKHLGICDTYLSVRYGNDMSSLEHFHDLFRQTCPPVVFAARCPLPAAEDNMERGF